MMTPPPSPTLARFVPALATIAMMACCGPVLAQTPAPESPAKPAAPPIPLELNKLEPVTQGGPGCRVYFVTSNPDSRPIDQLRLDLILFGSDGVIARRIAFDLAPLPARKTAVRLFDLAGLPCDDIARVLVNDVLACKSGDEPAAADQDHQACLDRLAVSSRAKVPLVK